MMLAVSIPMFIYFLEGTSGVSRDTSFDFSILAQQATRDLERRLYELKMESAGRLINVVRIGVVGSAVIVGLWLLYAAFTTLIKGFKVSNKSTIKGPIAIVIAIALVGCAILLPLVVWNYLNF